MDDAKERFSWQGRGIARGVKSTGRKPPKPEGRLKGDQWERFVTLDEDVKYLDVQRPPKPKRKRKRKRRKR